MRPESAHIKSQNRRGPWCLKLVSCVGYLVELGPTFTGLVGFVEVAYGTTRCRALARRRLLSETDSVLAERAEDIPLCEVPAANCACSRGDNRVRRSTCPNRKLRKIEATSNRESSESRQVNRDEGRVSNQPLASMCNAPSAGPACRARARNIKVRTSWALEILPLAIHHFPRVKVGE
jgi:hypothetical protein